MSSLDGESLEGKKSNVSTGLLSAGTQCNGEFCHIRAILIQKILMKRDETKNELEMNLNTSF